MDIAELKQGTELQAEIRHVVCLIENLQQFNGDRLYEIIAENDAYRPSMIRYVHESAASAAKEAYGAFLKNELQRLQNRFAAL